MDDIIITGSSTKEINCFVQLLHNKFSLKDIGELHYFLGVEVSRSFNGSLHLCQRKYIQDLLDRSFLVSMLMPTGVLILMIVDLQQVFVSILVKRLFRGVPRNNKLCLSRR